MEQRLQKILAHAGIASRRKAEELIEQGRVSVNGHIVQEMGTRADPASDTIAVDGKKIRPPAAPVYILVNKPKNVVSTARDPEGRETVLDLIRKKVRVRVYPVGRLDFGSEGLLILTNDGEFTRFMTKAGGVPKVYRAKVSGVPTESALARLTRGIRVDGERLVAASVEEARPGTNPWFRMTLTEGRNRQVRRMFEAIGHPVLKLRRTRIGFLEDSRLASGEWRHLTPGEVRRFYERYGTAKAEQRPRGARSRPAAGSKGRVRPEGGR